MLTCLCLNVAGALDPFALYRTLLLMSSFSVSVVSLDLHNSPAR